jgi:hypothetical protein
MKRIVTGHHTDPTSTWTVSEILPEEFEAIKDSIEHLKKKYEFLIGLSDDAWRRMTAESKQKLSIMSLDEFATSDDTMIEGRKVLSRDADILTALEARILLLALSNKMDELTELFSNEFRVLVDALSHYCTDLTNVINNSKEEILAQAQKLNKEEKMISEERLVEGLNKTTTEEHQEKTYAKTQMLYSMLEVINQPYDGVGGDRFNIPNKEKQTSIN